VTLRIQFKGSFSGVKKYHISRRDTIGKDPWRGPDHDGRHWGARDIGLKSESKTGKSKFSLRVKMGRKKTNRRASQKRGGGVIKKNLWAGSSVNNW